MVSTVEPQSRRKRVLRTLTFWLRPAFLLRVLNRFQRMAGFDRAVALGSSALTALIPMVVVLGAVLSSQDEHRAANHIVSRYHLSGAGAAAVRQALAPADGGSTSVTVVGIVLLIFTALSFARSMQRLFEQGWELKSLGVRNSLADLVWFCGLLLYFALGSWVGHLVRVLGLTIAASVLMIPASWLLLLWSGHALSGRRLGFRELMPFAVIGALAIAASVAVGSAYLPHLFSSYASRYGTIGAVLAMISALFVGMLVLVVATAVGREVADELDRIRRGERPPDREVRQEWDELRRQAHARFEISRERMLALRTRFRRGA